MSNKGKRYDNEYKEEIIRLVQEEKRSITKVAEDFGISEQTIRNWIKANDSKKNPDNNRIAELEMQLKEEKRKNADLQQTVDILKKATAFFVQDSRK